LGWLEALNLENRVARTFVSSIQAPLYAEYKRGILACLDMLYDRVEPYVSSEVWSKYQNLRDPSSNDYLLLSNNYYCFITYSLFTATLPEEEILF
jgi:hypothetical protein